MSEPFDDIDCLYFVWNADRSVGGAFRAVADYVRGVESCALCDIAYVGVRKKPAWNECQASLPVPIETLCKNQLDEPLARAADGDYPVVLASVNGAIVKLLGRDAIEQCEGDVDRFREALLARAAAPR